jgi:hypothetical protein
LNATSLTTFSCPRLEVDIIGTNSTCKTWSAGKNTGAPHADLRVLSEWVAVAKLIGPRALAALHRADVGADNPDENWGRSDDLKEQGKGEKEKKKGEEGVDLRTAMGSTAGIRTQIR